MKRNHLILIAVALAIVVVLATKLLGVSNPDSEVSIPTQIVQEDHLRLILDFGQNLTEFDTQYYEGITVLDALENSLEENGVELETTYYEEFDSTMVNSINGFDNSDEYSWIYYVNGSSGEVGADQKVLDSGDVVEWKYVKPTY